jgi:hypothetical protein
VVETAADSGKTGRKLLIYHDVNSAILPVLPDFYSGLPSNSGITK